MTCRPQRSPELVEWIDWGSVAIFILNLKTAASRNLGYIFGEFLMFAIRWCFRKPLNF